MQVTEKITKTTFKSFIKRNHSRLVVKITSKFDGMDDCTRSTGNGFTSANSDSQWVEHSYGIAGVWLVNGGRDSFEHYETETHLGIRYYNCCGSGVVAVEK